MLFSHPDSTDASSCSTSSASECPRSATRRACLLAHGRRGPRRSPCRRPRLPGMVDAENQFCCQPFGRSTALPLSPAGVIGVTWFITPTRSVSRSRWLQHDLIDDAAEQILRMHVGRSLGLLQRAEPRERTYLSAVDTVLQGSACRFSTGPDSTRRKRDGCRTPRAHAGVPECARHARDRHALEIQFDRGKIAPFWADASADVGARVERFDVSEPYREFTRGRGMKPRMPPWKSPVPAVVSIPTPSIRARPLNVSAETVRGPRPCP